ncbi:MAG: S-methyl-5-thioribose-1-phosphate isomerase [Deltaproteobacteria bacterium]|nr:S-methyl-5-thioribose-1-phosphate isomerase [Deltaproteobacteria bacterium]
MFKTIEWKKTGVVMIDQRLLPGKEVYNTYTDYKGVAGAIKDMVVRGAPAIGVAAAMGVAIGASGIKTSDPAAFRKELGKICDLLASTRPTAVNLFWGIERMRSVAASHPGASVATLKRLLVDEAKKIHREDIAICREIGRHGGTLLKDGSTVLTHCNAGALATAGYGTALGVIRGAIDRGKKIAVYADETRPFLQGARLTAWELHKDKIDCTLITDNMAGYIMGKGLINAVVVGADRIAANGDTANKIGTYSVAILAKEHGIPFYVAAPLSTIDLKIKHGDEIPIEERNTNEVTQLRGSVIAPKGIKVRNPAFDVTPNRLVTAIITEKGVVKKPYIKGLKALFAKGSIK